MDELISKRQIIEEIRDHAQRVGLGNDFYQLAHDHIIRIIEKAPACNIDGAERIRKDKTDPIVLKTDNVAFLEGYKAAQDEFIKMIEQAIENNINRE